MSLKTPLLIPSFSSKGFTRSSKKDSSDVHKLLKTASEFLTDAYLVSAYDIFYDYLPKPGDLPCKTDIVVVDSGGYEVSADNGYSAVFQSPYHPKSWESSNLESILAQWPDEMPAILVSFDHPDERKPLQDQVADAKRLFRTHSQHLRLFLLKPQTSSQRTLSSSIASAIADIDLLRTFDVIGLTEKELGRTMLDRMCAIAKLRIALDDAGLMMPLHIFGGLDPLTVCLYYVCGAELFDGLSWLRYAYKSGLCVYTHNVGVLDYGLHVSDDDVRTRTLTNNYYHLQELRHQLLKLEATGDPMKLDYHGCTVVAALDSMKTRFKERF